jgi:tetratricopeptide (TPR) repeat protein
MRTALIAAILCCGVAAPAEEPTSANDEADRWAQQATVLHKQAQQEKNEKKYEDAHALYQKYLAKYPDVNDGVLSFYDAELLFHLQRYDEAAKMYERVITIAPKGKHLDEAAYAFVMATKNAARPTDQAGRKPPCPDMKPCAIPPDLQRLVAAFDRYIAVVAAGKERPNIEYRRARVFYEYQHFAEAAAQFDRIFASYPDNELAIYSANLEMDCLAILKRFDELRALVERVKKSPAMKDETTQRQIQDMEAGLKKRGK